MRHADQVFHLYKSIQVLDLSLVMISCNNMRLLINFSRRAIHMGRITPEIDPDLASKLEDGSINPKNLITRRKYGNVPLPAKLQLIAEKRLQRFGDAAFRDEARHLFHVMRNLKLPDDQQSLRMKKADIKTQLDLRDKVPDFSPSEFRLYEEDNQSRDVLAGLIQGTLAERTRDWHYYEYDEKASLLYMATRLAPNYACLRTVMNEIHDLCPTFKPRSVLDFGSGMGTTMWAVENVWPNSVSEFMNIDISKEQQYLSEFLLRGGDDSSQDSLPGVFYRQFLPTSTKVKYDLVVAAFSMLELPNKEMRAHVIENLWQKTNDMLVIIERGNRGGFATINEARHFILDLSGHDVTKKINFTLESRLKFQRKTPQAYVLAPCAHEFACPRASMSTKNDADLCRFRIVYEPLEYGEQKPGYLREEFSYVVLRKGAHPVYEDASGYFRPSRIVARKKKSSGQVTHLLCCSNGNLAETTITKKYGRSTYSLAKSCDWGDLLPLRVKDTYFSKNTSRRLKG